MAQSGDGSDPRDVTRGMRKEVRAEFEAAEANDTGGQEHASRDDREGIPAGHRPREVAASGPDRATREQSDADALRVPRGDAGTGGGNAAGGRGPRGPGEPEER